MSPSPVSFSKLPTPEAIHKLEMTIEDAIPEKVQKGRAAWRRDLPKLLATHRGQWVSYHGERQVGVGQTKTELVQHCLEAGLKRGEFVVLRIEPETEQEVSVPVDV